MSADIGRPALKETRGDWEDRHEEKVIKPGFRQSFMGSQTQTAFEVVKRFWAYNSDNSDWRKNKILIKVFHTVMMRYQKKRKQDHIKDGLWKKRRWTTKELHT